MAPADMGSFDCSSRCDDLCNSEYKESAFFQLSSLYPGLTAAERALTASHPSEMIEAYKLSWRAESLCKDIYFSSERNDESDACRHFIWAGLMTQKIGKDLSKRISDAHEEEPRQKEADKEMDITNNKYGQKAAEELLKSKQFSENAMVEQFKNHLKNKKVIVLEPRSAND